MRTLEDFDFELPEEKIACYPAEPRDTAKLLHYNRKTKTHEDLIFKDIINFIRKDDLLVVNNSKVIPARIFGKKNITGAKLEVFILKMNNETIEAYVRPSKRVKDDTIIELADNEVFSVKEKLTEGKFLLKHSLGENLLRFLKIHGNMPLPPYIEKNRPANKEDFADYQTVYAGPEGSVACPTAGLHFTLDLINDIKNKGADFADITLHVGPGTFKPVSADKIEDHIMHEEFYEIDEINSKKIEKVRNSSGRIIAIGTTVVRTLEHVCSTLGGIEETSGSTDIFIREGYEFKCIDALITNFHLPRSTLLMLVCGFTSFESAMNIYKHALKSDYRFYSYGDAMFIE